MRRAAITVILVAVLLAGCDNDEPVVDDVQPNDEPSPCQLVTRAEVTAALGQPVSQALGPTPAPPYGTECFFSAGDSSYVVVGLTAADTTQISELRAVAGDPVDLTGLGADAFVDGPDVYAVRGRWILHVGLVGLPSNPDAGPAIARIAVGRLP